jgi:organic radical activating enzyme
MSEKRKVNIHLGRDNLSATIFVPTNCSNNCKFCTSKENYHLRQPNLEKVLKAIRKLNKIDWIDSFVLTGGEPFADLNVLSILLNEISLKKKVYINTTLPTNKYTEKEIISYINSSKINGINISRHCVSFEKDQMFFTKDIMRDKSIGKIKRPVKINFLVNDKSNIKQVLDRWFKYDNVFVSFRADYRKVTKASLKDLQDDLVTSILTDPDIVYLTHGGCDVCFDITFCYKNQFYFSLHRGMEHSSIQFANELIINDIIVSQDGYIYYDWDMQLSRIKVKSDSSP